MKKKISQTIISKVRRMTPLWLRQRIGPILAQLYYVDRVFLKRHQVPEILSIPDSIALIKAEKKSVIRFGDGEITLLDGDDLLFQKWSPDLSSELEDIIQAQHEQLLICIPNMWGSLNIFEPYAKKFIKHHMYRHKHIWDELLRYDYTYGDTNFTRNYLCFKDKSNATEVFSAIKSLWEDEDVILIEGEKSRLGVGNDLFNSTKTLKRVLCPAENAYAKKNEILNAIKGFSKDHLILTSLGPAAKCLAYQLFLDGYRVLDIGHIDMEYEMYLRKSDHQVAVPYKYFNEINARNPEECRDEHYLEQVVNKIV